MKHNFCTIFDSNYLAKGIAMLRSLKKHSPESEIHVLAMDKNCFDVLWETDLPDHGVVLWTMEFFLQETRMWELVDTRTHQEFCWTCGAVFTDEVMRFKDLDELTYVDADTFYFSDPEVVFDEIGDKSIGITPHRFAKVDEARLLPNGKYAVQWVTFKGEVGRKCLSEWAENVRRWCFYKHENGLFADQKYLNFWERDYPGQVCEINNIGAGVAPWNFNQYSFSMAGETLLANDTPVVFFHAHEFRDNGDGAFRLTNWPVSESARELLYGPYVEAMKAAMAQIAEQNSLRSVGA